VTDPLGSGTYPRANFGLDLARGPDRKEPIAYRTQILEAMRAGWMVKQDGLSNHIHGMDAAQAAIPGLRCPVSIDNESDQAS